MAFSINRLLSIYCFIRLTLITHSQCTSTDSDTCYITRSTTWSPTDSNIQCDNQLPKCIITCSTSDSSCSSANTGFPVHIICPLDATSCIINCQSPKSCEGATILATTSKYTQINIASTDAGKSMTIYSPGYNGGTLHINLQNEESDFYESTIKAQQNSSNIHINCQNGHLCTDNNIEGMRVEGSNASISLLCNGYNSADCSNTNIYCSDNKMISTKQAICNIDCRNKQTATCNNLNIYTNNGILDPLYFKCANHANSCSGTQLYCGPNQNDEYSNLIWDNQNLKWIYEIGTGMCGFFTENPTQKPTISPVINIDNNSAGSFLSFVALDPLYYIIFILTLSLCCVICILMFWMYHQNKFTKELGFSDDVINKINDEDFEITSNGSILPKASPRNIGQFTRLQTTSKKSNTLMTEPNTPIPNINLNNPLTQLTNNNNYTLNSGEYKMSDSDIINDDDDDDSLILESSPMYNPHYNDNRNIFNNKSQNSDTKSITRKSNKSKSKSPMSNHSNHSHHSNNNNIIQRIKTVSNNNSDTMNASQISISMMNTPSHDTEITEPQQQIQLKTIHQNQSSESSKSLTLPNKRIKTKHSQSIKSIQSPMSMLSGVPTLVDSQMSNLSLHSHAKTAPVQVHIINENEAESNSESESNNSNSDNTDNTRQTELTELTELTKDGINNDNILDTLSRKKSKFALPAAYHNMSPHTVKKILKKNEDAIIEYTKQISLDPNHPHHNIHKQIEIQQKHIKKISRPNMPIMPISPSIPSTHQIYHIQHAVPYNINNLHIPPKDHKYNHKHKINKKHRKKKNKSVATSVVSELTELTEVTEQTDNSHTLLSPQSQVSHSQVSQSQQSHSSEYTESEDTNDSDTIDTEYTDATEVISETNNSYTINTNKTTKIYTNRNVRADDKNSNSNSSNSSSNSSNSSQLSHSDTNNSCSTGTDLSDSNSSMSATDYNDDIKDEDDDYTQTYNDDDEEEDNYTYRSSNREQSKTLNSRITYNERSAKEITIKSDILDADIMDVLYDNKIKPLFENDNNNNNNNNNNKHMDNELSQSSSVPSPQSVSYNDDDEDDDDDDDDEDDDDDDEDDDDDDEEVSSSESNYANSTEINENIFEIIGRNENEKYQD